MNYELSQLAIDDIDSIWEYTVLNWSIKQAEKYYQSIIRTIKLICENPEIGKSISEVKETHKRKNIGSHMILYKLQNDVIYIDRILHQRMDIDSQLSE
jgi:toxin ParE1/3/4